jgi:antagonist of KipI
MSLRIIKAGILDTVQDTGRRGYQHLGINPGGAMDRFAVRLVNALVGNAVEEAVIEMHFPAPAMLFEKEALIAVGGADFSPAINGEDIPLFHPIIVSKNSILQFRRMEAGARCYLSVQGGFDITRWLNSYSTHLKATAGGFHGKALLKDDVLNFRKQSLLSSFLNGKHAVVLPWQANEKWNDSPVTKIFVLPGHEWKQLSEMGKSKFQRSGFTITNAADRMGYRLKGPSLQSNTGQELVSSAVNFGTIQLLPDGQLILLMADHQTTGGYPRVAHVISAHHSIIAQLNPGRTIHFSFVDQTFAENLLLKQQQHLSQLENGCKYRLDEYYSEL